MRPGAVLASTTRSRKCRSIGKARDDIEWIRIASNRRVGALLSRWSDEDETTIGLLGPVADDCTLAD